MHKNSFRSFVSMLALFVPVFASASAHAGIDACGNIDVSAQAQCTVEADPIVCSGKCDSVTFQAACEGKLTAECKATPPSCSASCQGSCESSCTVEPGKFDCSVDCKGKCDADCAGQCSASGNQAQCQSQCKAQCSGQCDASCTATPASADCKAKCQGSCSGACTGGQLSCKAVGELKCEADLKANCKVQCNDPKGALFCDSSYVDRGGNLDECVNALKKLGAKVEAHASSSGQCSGNSCEGEAEAGCSMSTVPTADASKWPIALGVLGVFASVGVLGRRRRRAR